ncbi:MAG: PD40 domain-containing protein [Xanthomonadales bacterium]|nr:PD40 domain-containing protein [Xanthomonadales bacterium]
MKRWPISSLLLVPLLAVGKSDPSADQDALRGPYLGQKPPGMIAEPFAPGVISTPGWELEGVFAPGMDEFYYTTRIGDDTRPTVIGFRQQDGVWIRFTSFPRRGEISFSPDGKRMHMAKGFRDRTADGWSERQSLGDMFDRDDWGIMRLSASARGSYVFDDFKSGDVIRISVLRDGVRQPPVPLDEAVNSGTYTAHPFIAPDESYLIWDSKRASGYGDSDLYIRFRDDDGQWGPAINMGAAVNSPSWDAFATVTPDGRFLLFNRGMDDDNANVDIYWVDARIIDELRAAHATDAGTNGD